MTAAHMGIANRSLRAVCIRKCSSSGRPHPPIRREPVSWRHSYQAVRPGVTRRSRPGRGRPFEPHGNASAQGRSSQKRLEVRSGTTSTDSGYERPSQQPDWRPQEAGAVSADSPHSAQACSPSQKAWTGHEYRSFHLARQYPWHASLPMPGVPGRRRSISHKNMMPRAASLSSMARQICRSSECRNLDRMIAHRPRPTFLSAT
jgi:hypothetical protein